MISMEMKKKFDERVTALEQRFMEVFESIEINGETCFQTVSGRIFTLTVLAPFNAIVVEHADNAEAATQNAYDDGDPFDIDEYSEDEMFVSMLEEIEESEV